MKELKNYLYDDIYVGQTISINRKITSEIVNKFAHLSQDFNPAHLDPEYASSTIFKKVIAHGMLSGALISAVLGSHFPGPGTIYLGQELNFYKPVYLDDELIIQVTVTEKCPKNKLKLSCKCINQNAEVVCSGDANILAPIKRLSRNIVTRKNQISTASAAL